MYLPGARRPDPFVGPDETGHLQQLPGPSDPRDRPVLERPPTYTGVVFGPGLSQVEFSSRIWCSTGSQTRGGSGSSLPPRTPPTTKSPHSPPTSEGRLLGGPEGRPWSGTRDRGRPNRRDHTTKRFGGGREVEGGCCLVTTPRRSALVTEQD